MISGVKVKEFLICAKCGDKIALLLARTKESRLCRDCPEEFRIPKQLEESGSWEWFIVLMVLQSVPRAKPLPAFLLGILDHPLSTSLRPLVVFKGFIGSVPPEDVIFQVSFFIYQSIAIFVPKRSRRSFQTYFWSKRTCCENNPYSPLGLPTVAPSEVCWDIAAGKNSSLHSSFQFMEGNMISSRNAGTFMTIWMTKWSLPRFWSSTFQVDLRALLGEACATSIADELPFGARCAPILVFAVTSIFLPCLWHYSCWLDLSTQASMVALTVSGIPSSFMHSNSIMPTWLIISTSTSGLPLWDRWIIFAIYCS